MNATSPQADQLFLALGDPQKKYPSLWIFQQSISAKYYMLPQGLHSITCINILKA